MNSQSSQQSQVRCSTTHSPSSIASQQRRGSNSTTHKLCQSQEQLAVWSPLQQRTEIPCMTRTPRLWLHNCLPYKINTLVAFSAMIPWWFAKNHGCQCQEMLDTDPASTYLIEPPSQGGSVQAKKPWSVAALRNIWNMWEIFLPGFWQNLLSNTKHRNLQ